MKPSLLLKVCLIIFIVLGVSRPLFAITTATPVPINPCLVKNNTVPPLLKLTVPDMYCCNHTNNAERLACLRFHEDAVEAAYITLFTIKAHLVTLCTEESYPADNSCVPTVPTGTDEIQIAIFTIDCLISRYSAYQNDINNLLTPMKDAYCH